MNIRNRLEGLERRVGTEGQQHEAVIRELRTSLKAQTVSGGCPSVMSECQ